METPSPSSNSHPQDPPSWKVPVMFALEWKDMERPMPEFNSSKQRVDEDLSYTYHLVCSIEKTFLHVVDLYSSLVYFFYRPRVTHA